MEELWVEIPGFENYSVSNYGAVRNHRGRFIWTGKNQYGLMYVQLHREGRPHNRALAPIVAGAFLEPPPHHSWDTPIHLNGNRADVIVSNLMWRPRWFAIVYHSQIRQYGNPANRVRDVETGEEDSIQSLSKRYGLLPLKVMLQAHKYTLNGDRQERVWPTGQMFELA